MTSLFSPVSTAGIMLDTDTVPLITPSSLPTLSDISYSDGKLATLIVSSAVRVVESSATVPEMG